MGKPQKLNKRILQDDADAFAAMQAIMEYKPNNPDFELVEVRAAYAAMQAKQTDEVQKEAAAEAAKDAARDAEHAFHQMMLGVKTQIKSQFGESSDEYASLGLKKKDEYRRGKRRAAKPSNNPI